MPKKTIHGPTKFVQPEYGQRVQYSKNENKGPIDKKLQSKIQSACGKFLYSGRAIDNTTAHALNKLCIEASTASEGTKTDIKHISRLFSKTSRS